MWSCSGRDQRVQGGAEAALSEEHDPEQLCLFSGATKTGARTSEPEL